MKNGGLITKTINTPTTSSASGVWSLQEQYEAETNDAWPKALDPNVSTDPYFSDVTLLLKFEGANNGTTFTDSSNNNCTITLRSTTTNTSIFKFGTSSGYFSVNSSYLSVSSASSGVSDFGTGDFTAEMFVYRTTSGRDIFYDTRQSSQTTGHFSLSTPTSGSNLQVVINGVTYATTNSIPTNQWSHIAATRENGTVRGFVDGVLGVTSTNNTVSITDGTNGTYPPMIGATGNGWGSSSSNNHNGYIDELRITKGVARYTSTFTPPTAGFLTS